MGRCRRFGRHTRSSCLICSRHPEKSGTTTTDKRTAPAVHDGCAIASLILSLVWLGGLASLLGVIFGAMSEHEAKRQMRRTSGLAIAGQVIGVLGILAVVGYILIWRQAAGA